MNITAPKIEGTREQKYNETIPVVQSLVNAETDRIANMANIASIIKEVFGFHWVGFYRVVGEELVLGPFQGPLACTRIKYGKGVCGTSWMKAETIIVPDVDLFPGHIACSSLSKSEIVVPVVKNGKVTAVLDIDSEKLDDFSDIDAVYLQQITELLAV
jgi:GAF domain-containing protein